MSMLKITNENYEAMVEQAKQPVLVEFWAPWCTYCRRIAGVVAKLPDAYEGRAAVGQVNIDEEPELARKFGVDTIPTLLLMKDGQPGAPLVAPGSKADIDAWMEAQSV
ncbi:MAG: thioredoxin family protein [Eubacteriales bacterium]|nr:thioredoxin family protein [Eubacteriales bacterium]